MASNSTAPKSSAGKNIGGTIPKLPPCGFLVSAGKKGNIPVSVEKRPKGKKVTIISNVQGSAKSLLSALSSLLGIGGTVRQEASGLHWTVEVQGDQTERVGPALVQMNCLKGVKKEEDDKKKGVEVASRACAYDKFLRKGGVDKSKDGDISKKPLVGAYSGSVIVPGAACTKWHGAWYYCRGYCMQSDLDDVWEETLMEQDSMNSPSYSSAPKSAPSSTAELNIALSNLGLLPVVGGAHRVHRMSRNPNAGGMSLDEYRKAALAPGARLITDEAGPTKPKDSRQKPMCNDGRKRYEAKQSSKPAKMPEPPKIGTFQCQVCNTVFGLAKTLKLHMRNAHPGVQSQPQSKPLANVHSNYTLPKSGGRPESQSTEPAWDRGEMVAPQNAPEYNYKLSDAMASLPSQYSETTEAATSGSTRASRFRKEREQFRLCPVCDEFFEDSFFETHVETCVARCAEPYLERRRENGSQKELEIQASNWDPPTKASSSFQIGDKLEVAKPFQPAGEGRENQLSVKEGDTVVVSWAGDNYWVYVSTAPRDRRLQPQFGYVPASNLKKVATPHLSPVMAPTPAIVSKAIESVKSFFSDQDAVPAEWLEAFLELDLSEKRAQRFWLEFEALQQTLNREEAWIQALSKALHSQAIDKEATNDMETQELYTSRASLIDSDVPKAEESKATEPPEPISIPSELATSPQEEIATTDLETTLLVAQQTSCTGEANTKTTRNRWARKRGSDYTNGSEVVSLHTFEPTSLPGVGDRVVESVVAVRPCSKPIKSETETWALVKIEELVKRFCASRIDPEVVFASLGIYRSAAEMRSEAVSLLGDFEPVKNFAAELWRRQSVSRLQ